MNFPQSLLIFATAVIIILLCAVHYCSIVQCNELLFPYKFSVQ